MSRWSQQRTQITPDRDIFAFDARRAARIVWVVITLSTIASLVGANQQDESWVFFAITIAITATALSVLLDFNTQNTASYIPSAAAHLLLPVIFADKSTTPWASYGLLSVAAIIYMVALENIYLVISSIVLLTANLYFVSSQNYTSISDNVDNTLLYGYFSTTWCLIVGIGALLLKIAYLKYSKAIEETIAQIYQLQLTEKAKLSQLNLRDFENSQLHGTILNTLIAIRNAPSLLLNRTLVSEYLRRDIAFLKSEAKAPGLTVDDLQRELSTLPFQRELKVEIEIAGGLELTDEFRNLVREISRELILNTAKHSEASHCLLKIYAIDFVSDEYLEGDLLFKEIVIEAIDNSPEISEISEISLSSLIEGSKKSESLGRLIRNINGSIEVSAISKKISRRVILPMPREPQNFVTRISKLRTEAIQYIGIGYIRISFFFGFIAFPGYLYLGINREVIFLLVGHYLFTGAALIFEKYSSWFAVTGALIAISIFPFLSLQSYKCEDLQYLPWLFNSIIGSIFLSSMLIKQKFIRWLPTIIFYLACITISEGLPVGCQNLLAGSTPGIILISLIALGISYARKRDLTYEERFITSAQKEFGRLERLREKVIAERSELISKIDLFAHSINDDSNNLDLLPTINRLILEIRAFLLLSEYLDNPLIDSLYLSLKDRFAKGHLTHLEVNCTEFPLFTDSTSADKAVRQISEWAKDREIRISISKYKDLVLQANLEPDQTSQESESGHHENNLSFHFTF
jgi:hypothetical protein